MSNTHAWSSDPKWNAQFLHEVLRTLLTGPTAGAFLRPGLQGTARFEFAEALGMAETVAGELLEIGQRKALESIPVLNRMDA